MANRSRSTFKKRQKEIARQQKQLGKQARRRQRKEERKEITPLMPGEDPDIAGILPGPQPRQDDESES